MGRAITQKFIQEMLVEVMKEEE